MTEIEIVWQMIKDDIAKDLDLRLVIADEEWMNTVGTGCHYTKGLCDSTINASIAMGTMPESLLPIVNRMKGDSPCVIVPPDIKTLVNTVKEEMINGVVGLKELLSGHPDEEFMILVFSLLHEIGHAIDLKDKTMEESAEIRDKEMMDLAVKVDALMKGGEDEEVYNETYARLYRQTPMELSADIYALEQLKKHYM